MPSGTGWYTNGSINHATVRQADHDVLLGSACNPVN
jgi:hypothetical protein